MDVPPIPIGIQQSIEELEKASIDELVNDLTEEVEEELILRGAMQFLTNRYYYSNAILIQTRIVEIHKLSTSSLTSKGMKGLLDSLFATLNDDIATLSVSLGTLPFHNTCSNPIQACQKTI